MSDIDPRFQAARLVLALRQAGVTDQPVTEALERTPRDVFAPKAFAEDAWENVELPIDCGQTMTRPVTVGMMLQALDVQREHTVLEVGCGSGYVAAVLSRLARRVYSVDRFRTLVERTRAAVEHLGLSSRVEVRLGDGLMGWTEAAPFDRVLLMGAVTGLPEDIARQVGAGGIVVMPVMRDGQGLILRLQKQPDGAFAEQIIAKEAFPPLIPGVAREL
ncbi:MAG: protein-L-isoaspartate O-methyltransferase [Alphaproteobacteria bacterium 32-64-14]|nr:MAG: protein-L-isoaspartate O-methyltransferase [Alphaproteobacteria bacterium 32-64-14]